MTTWILYALLSAVFAGLVAIFGKVGLQGVDTTLATTIRAIIMATFLVVVSITLGKFDINTPIATKTLSFIVLSGVAGALSWLFYFSALKAGPAPAVAALDRLSVVFVLAFALLFLGEHLTWKNGIGAILVASGAMLMVMQ